MGSRVKQGEVYDKMDDCLSWINAESLPRLAFIREAQDIQYGKQELQDAWEWFLCGYDAK